LWFFNYFLLYLDPRKATTVMRTTEDKYRNLFENGVIGIFWSTLSDGTVLEANRAMVEMFGISSFEGASATDFYDDPGERQNFIAALQKNGSIRNYEIHFRRKDGSRFWGSHSAGLNRKTGIIEGLIIDVSDRKAAEEALRENEIKYRTLFDSANDAIVIFKDGKVLEANRQALALFGCTMEEIKAGELPLTFSPPLQPNGHSSRSKGLNYIRKAAAGEPQSFEWKHIRRDGKPFDAEVSLHRIELGGEIVVQSVMRDVSERKRAEEDLKKAHADLVVRTAELESVNKELEAFSYSVSHDLRAPLRAIDGFSQALLEDYNEQLDEQGQDFLRRVRAASQRMALLIDDMLKLSRISRAELRLGEVDLSAVASAIVDEMRKMGPDCSIEFTVEPDIVVRGDQNLLRVVLENLLDNARKFSGNGPGTVAFGKEVKKGKSVLFVKDNGVGFNMAHANKLFVPFQRLHRDDEFQGLGIGLATVQRIIHRHGGQIWAEGEVGKGATFYFTI
jgi:PAS domain S-box-containing protein